MMEFVRRLAPAAARDRTRAFAALPSRFESRAPLHGTAMQTVTENDAYLQQTHVVAEQTAAPFATGLSPATQRTLAVAGSPPFMPAQELHFPSPVSRPASAAPPTPSRESAGSATPPTIIANELPGVSREIDSTLSVPQIPAQPSTRDTPGPKAESVAARSHPVAPQAKQPHSAVERPIPQAVLAVRNARSSVPRPIIHVSIDRIEVRAAPFAPRPASSKQQKKAQAPSVSLGDYLRQRTTNHGGAR